MERSSHSLRKTRIPALLAMTALLGMFGCKSLLVTTAPASRMEIPVGQLLDSVSAHEGFDLLTAKIQVDYTSEKDARTFSVRARFKKDSIIWLSITPALGIEVFRLTITPDSIKMLNRLDKKYFSESFEDAKQILQVDVDYNILQSVLTGGFVRLYDNRDYTVSYGPGKYEVVADINRIDPDSVPRVWEQRSVIGQGTWKNMRSLLHSPSDQQQILAEYGDFVQLQRILFPTGMHFMIEAKEKLTVNLKWTKVEEKNSLRFPFHVPNKYEAYQ